MISLIDGLLFPGGSKTRPQPPDGRTVLLTMAMMVLLAVDLPGLKAESSRRPNFVVIMADDLGYGDIGCFGNRRIQTPHIDGLAAGGISFTDFHSSGTVCSPTRAGLMTGRYQQRAGVPGVISAKNHRHIGLGLDQITFAELLREAGYKTAIYGKWHLGYQSKFNPVHQGFDRFRGYVSGNVDFFSHIDQTGKFDWWRDDVLSQEEGYTTHLITKHAVRFIEENKDHPFCLYLPHEAPHYPYQGPRDKPERTVGGSFNTQGSRKDVAVAYKEMVETMDVGVGQVMSTLKRLGLQRDTLVFFFSDNGANQRGNNGGLRGFKGSVWEGGHRVPAAAYWPGRIESGRQCNDLTITLDLFPTLLDVANVSLPKSLQLDGLSLSPVLLEKRSLGDRTLFWGSGAQRAMRDGPWKLVSRAKGQGKEPMLFNLGQDRNEQSDLAAKYRKRVQKMMSEIQKWGAEVGPSQFPKPAANLKSEVR